MANQQEAVGTSSPPALAAPHKSADINAEFMRVMGRFLNEISTCFPANTTASLMAGQIPLMDFSPGLKVAARKEWREMTLASVDQISARDLPHLVELIEAKGNPSVKMMNIHLYLADPSVHEDTKECIWQYLILLTGMSHAKSLADVAVTAPPPSPDSKVTAAGTVAAPAVGAAVAAGGGGAAPAAAPKLDMTQVMNQVMGMIPQIKTMYNEITKDDGSENPFGAFVKNLVEPGSVQTGIAGNVAANLYDQNMGADSPVMQQVQAELGEGVSAEDILLQLRELDALKKVAKLATAKRPTRRKSRSKK